MTSRKQHDTINEPLIRSLILLALVLTAAGILQGYAALGRRTASRYGMEDFGLFHASGRQFLEQGDDLVTVQRPGHAHGGLAVFWALFCTWLWLIRRRRSSNGVSPADVSRRIRPA